MENRPYHRMIQLLLKHVKPCPVTGRELIDQANLHQKIAGIYSRFEQPWAIPHFTLAQHYWETYRSTILDLKHREHFFTSQGKILYYGLGTAYLRELTRKEDTIDPVIDEDRIAKDFLKKKQLDRSPENWIRYAFSTLEALTARVYLEQIFGDVPPVTAEEVEEYISNSPVPLATLLCFPTATESQFIMITAGSCKYVTTSFGGDHLESLQTQMHEELTHRFFDPKCPVMECTSFWNSFQETFSELKSFLLELERNTILLVAGGEILTNLPLAGVKIGKEYLIDRHPVIFLSSISQCLRKKEHPAREKSRLLSVGVGRTERPAEATLSFNPLNAPCEIGKGENQFAVDHIGWNKVTKKNIIEALTKYSMALFSCHGTFYAQITTADSGLDLAGNERLTLDEISSLNLPIDLIFMNSCVSSKSRSIRTNEPEGIPMSFCLAGVDKVIGSLWNVWYQAGETFTRIFFETLAKTPSQHMARHYQQAVLKARSIHPDPYHWAGWALYGNYM